MIDKEKVGLIIEAVEYLLGAELLEENGWTDEKVDFLNSIVKKEVELSIKDN